MGDAAEVLAALYEKLAVVAGKAGKPTLLDDNFGLHVKVLTASTSSLNLSASCNMHLASIATLGVEMLHVTIVPCCMSAVLPGVILHTFHLC